MYKRCQTSKSWKYNSVVSAVFIMAFVTGLSCQLDCEPFQGEGGGDECPSSPSTRPPPPPTPPHSDHQSQHLHSQSGSVHPPHCSPDAAPDSRGARVMVSMPTAPRDSTEHPGPPGHPFQSRQFFPPPEVLVISRSELKLLQPSAKGSAWGAGGPGGCMSSSEVSWSGVAGRASLLWACCALSIFRFPYTGCPDKLIKATCKNTHTSNRYLSPSIYQALRKEWGQNENENFLHLRNIFVKGHLGGSVG